MRESLPEGLLPYRPGASRVLAFLAYPGDETLLMGGTLGLFSSLGVQVFLLTATRAEGKGALADELESLAPGLAQAQALEHARSADERVFIERRVTALEEAARQLGVRNRRFLGEPPAVHPGTRSRSYRASPNSWDSAGQARPIATPEPLVFAQHPIDEAVRDTAACLRAWRPDTVITYESETGLNDRSRCLAVMLRAVDLAAKQADAVHAPWQVSVVYGALDEQQATERTPPPGLLRASRYCITGDLDGKRSALGAYQSRSLLGAAGTAFKEGRERQMMATEQLTLVREYTDQIRTSESPAKGIVMAISAISGLGVSMLGTALHGQQLGVPTGGAWAAILLLAAALTFLWAWGRSYVAGLVGGVACYLGCVVWFMVRPESSLIGVDASGTIWVYGTAVVTATLTVGGSLGRSISRRGRARAKGERDQQRPHHDNEPEQNIGVFAVRERQKGGF